MKCYHCGKEIRAGDSVVTLELLRMSGVQENSYSASVKGEVFFHFRCFLKANVKLLVTLWKITGKTPLELRTVWYE